MSPVLLDHRNLKWIWLSVALLAFLTFFAGYILGFEKSNNKWMAKLDPVEIALPEVMASSLTVVEALPPEVEEPGGSIDVDSADGTENDLIPVANDPDAYTGVIEVAGIKVANAEPVKQIIKQINKKTAGPVQSQPEAVPISRSQTNQTTAAAASIVDDADAETATYSIQVGMYSNFENAEIKVSQLLNSNLNAYLDEYQNSKNETRYNVRFGYFASFASAQQALTIYEKSYADSGYIARIER
ncbi:MAG: SPOR domain-containing protein [Gammaproteobacteria bacterium]|nr:SPOR domain-containing protein [Gammaproteobacteria bacterium]